MIPLFAAILPVLILFCGLTVDVGLLELKKIQMQNAADAGALGAELEQERGTGLWLKAGQLDAGVNGFTDGVNNTTVTVVITPTSATAAGAYATYYNSILVTITRQQTTLFMGAFNGGKVSLSVTAVSLIPPCTSFLGNGTLTPVSFQDASGGLNANCPVYINTGLSVDGYSNLLGIGINVAGPASASSVQGWTSQLGSSSSKGPPNYGLPTMPDPLASITSPTFSGSCDYTSYKITTGSAILMPGNYCGTATTRGMTVTNSTVTLSPGLYVITGGAIWTNATITGYGVTLFFTKGNGANYGQFLANRTGSSTSTLKLSAPTTGSTPGILFFADRNWVATSSHDFQFDTDGSFSGDGIWYLKNAGVYIWLNNNFTIPTYGGFVVDNIYLFGTNLHPAGDYSSFPGGSPFRTQAVLVQ